MRRPSGCSSGQEDARTFQTPSVSTNIPSGTSEPRYRNPTIFPTASTITSYFSPRFLKSSRW